MYVPRHFRSSSDFELEKYVENNPFGILISVAPDSSIHVTHVPFAYDSDPSQKAAFLVSHLAVSNPQVQAIEATQSAVAVFHGAHHYVTPNWYETVPSVPTWNYSAVHVKGVLESVNDGDEIDQVLRLQTSSYEAQFDNSWDYDGLSQEYVRMRQRGIVAFRLRIKSVEAQFKFSQNRTDNDRRGVIHGLEGLATPSASEVANQMRRVSNDHRFQ